MKLISVVTPCYNEEQNVEEIYRQVKDVFRDLPHYKYEHLFIDNASTDKTVAILKALAVHDKNIKIIVNARNFGHLRSPFYGMLQAKGDAIISIVADLQDPPIMIKEFVKKWEEGYKIAIGVKPKSQENWCMSFIRKVGYRLIAKISEAPLISDFTGFGLYDRSFIDIIRKLDDPYPYFRGMVSEMGYSIIEIPYVQPVRKHGKTKNNFYTLFDLAMLSLTCNSKVPLRILTIAGFALSVMSLCLSMFFLILKLVFWGSFSFGVAPILIGLFFFSSVQLFFIGIVGEYVAATHTQVLKRPLVIEKCRINFD
ncbi:MAG: dolichol monophosphate mannose synthase [Gammaproteobacteria bacterium GWE2_37_16]|nr:MAG: dolichol monophosphate mannose synthase [Gammaproteobacteria bacterium GWE2_37_16]